MLKRGLWLVIGSIVAMQLVAPGTANASTGSSGGPSPQTWSEVSSMTAQVANATTSAQRLALTPQAALDAYPALQLLVTDGSSDALNSVIAAASQPGATPPGPLYFGDSIPACSPAGIELLPQFPAPYGLYAPNPLNNWCMPNGEDNGCSYVPDNSFWFDFRAACRQHDLAYRFTPTADRFAVDSQFLADMLKDCRYRNIVGRAACGTTAAIYFAGVLVIGAFVYGIGDIPGYDTPGGPVAFPPPPCNQPTHVWVAAVGTNIPQGTPIFPTGVVRANSRVRFTFTRNGSVVATQLTYFSDAGCVVRHERERLNSALLPQGTLAVSATYVSWETNQMVTQPVTTLQILPPSPYACNQPTHTWIAEGDPMTITIGTQLHVTGVVAPYSRITFQFLNQQGNVLVSHTTQPAAGNCVVAHEPEVVNTSSFPLGYVQVNATYLEWETASWVTQQIAILNLVAPPPGGGGGGGGGCLTHKAGSSIIVC